MPAELWDAAAISMFTSSVWSLWRRQVKSQVLFCFDFFFRSSLCGAEMRKQKSCRNFYRKICFSSVNLKYPILTCFFRLSMAFIWNSTIQKSEHPFKPSFKSILFHQWLAHEQTLLHCSKGLNVWKINRLLFLLHFKNNIGNMPSESLLPCQRLLSWHE